MDNGKLVFMDFDGTLTHFDSFVPYCLTALVHRPWRILALYRIVAALLRYVRKRIGRRELKEAFIRFFLGRARRENAERWNRLFFRCVFPLFLRTAIMRRARWHMERGDRVYIVSASPDIYLSAFVREWSFCGLICTRLEWKKGRVTGTIAGKNCTGEEKARRISDLFDEKGLSTAYGYGNSEGDESMFKLVGTAYRV